jgi:anaerobic magnesium-protoporphyrin IX monomethyl ester cyclase
LAASARDAGHEVLVLDADERNLSIDGIARWVGDQSPDIIGIPSFANSLTFTYKLAGELAKGAPSWQILLGGPHPTAAADDVIRQIPGCDLLLRGEAEDSLVELLNCLERRGELEEVAGLSFRRNGRIIHNRDAPIRQEIDVIPLPARDLLGNAYAKNTYWRLGHRGTTDLIISSRGCPFSCNFCSKVAPGYRMRSAENVMKELQAIRSMGTRNVHFMDDLFVSDRKRCLDICRAIQDEKLGMKFKVRGRVNTVDNELLAELKAAGTKAIVYGVESGSQKILDAMNKRQSVEQARDAVMATKRHGLEVYLDMMLGYPGETPETIAQTEKFILDVKPTAVRLEVLFPLPATQVYKEAKANGTLVSDWDIGAPRPYVKLPWLEDHYWLYAECRRITRRFARHPAVFFQGLKAVLPGLNFQQLKSITHYFLQGSIHSGKFMTGKTTSND